MSLLVILSGIFFTFNPLSTTTNASVMGSSCQYCADVGRTDTQTITSKNFLLAEVLLGTGTLLLIVSLVLNIKGSTRPQISRRLSLLPIVIGLLALMMIVTRSVLPNSTSSTQLFYADTGSSSYSSGQSSANITHVIIYSSLIIIVVTGLVGYIISFKARTQSLAK